MFFPFLEEALYAICRYEREDVGKNRRWMCASCHARGNVGAGQPGEESGVFNAVKVSYRRVVS